MDKFFVAPPKLGNGAGAVIVLTLVEKLAMICARLASFYYILKLILWRKRLTETQMHKIHEIREVRVVSFNFVRVWEA